MKRLLTVALAFLFSCGLALAQSSGSSSSMSGNNSASAQDNNAQTQTDKKTAKAEKKEASKAEKGKSMTLTGWVKDENGKTVFVNDKDKQSWDIANKDAVSGHEGHHVKVKAKLNEADHSMTVESVKMMKKAKQANHEKTGS